MYKQTKCFVKLLLFIIIIVFISSCSSFKYRDISSYKGKDFKEFQRGVASWYGRDFHGRRTANGEIYNMNKLTAAHKRLPFNTLVKVENLDNGKSVIVRINDRGPFVKRRIIDLSKKAAKQISMIGRGTANVILKIVNPEKKSYINNNKQADKVYFIVQSAAFSRYDNAQNHLKELSHLITAPFFIIKEDNLYKTQSYKIRFKQEALILNKYLKEKGYNSFIKSYLK